MSSGGANPFQEAEIAALKAEVERLRADHAHELGLLRESMMDEVAEFDRQSTLLQAVADAARDLLRALDNKYGPFDAPGRQSVSEFKDDQVRVSVRRLRAALDGRPVIGADRESLVDHIRALVRDVEAAGGSVSGWDDEAAYFNLPGYTVRVKRRPDRGHDVTAEADVPLVGPTPVTEGEE